MKNNYFTGSSYDGTNIRFNFNNGKINLYLKFNNEVSIKTDKIIKEQDNEFLPLINKLRNSSFCRDFEAHLAFHDVARKITLERCYLTAPSEYMYHTSEKNKKIERFISM